MSFVHALKWSFLAEMASKAVTPVVFIVLARLLTPRDFGVMSAAAMVIAFCQIFWEAGMGKALIQRQNDLEDAANVAFWVNIALGILMASLLLWTAEPIARTFFQDERVTAVLQVMTLAVLLGSLSSVQTALLQKEMGFKKLFWVRLTTVALPGMASIPLAWNGMGYWALVAGTLTGQAVQVAMLWVISGWRPAWRFNPSVAKEMGRFGIWVGGSGVLGWLYLWADSLVVGRYLGSHQLGIYRSANQFAIMIFVLILGPIAPVLYSQLSRMNKDRQRFMVAIQKIIKIIILASIPISALVYGFSPEIGTALFGARWEGIGFVIGVLTLAQGLAWTVGMNSEVYRAYGKPYLETLVMAAGLLIYLPAYVYTIQISFEVFVWNRLALALVGTLLQLYLLREVLGLKIFPILNYLVITALLSFLFVGVSKYLVSFYITDVWCQIAIGLPVTGIFLMAAILVAERKGAMRDALAMVKAR
jgi:O-antigen/teichoic acid export membrane protein